MLGGMVLIVSDSRVGIVGVIAVCVWCGSRK